MLRTLAWSAFLVVVAGCADSQGADRPDGPLIDATAVQLFAAAAGLTDPGPLHLDGQVAAGGGDHSSPSDQIFCLETEGGTPWLLVSADGWTQAVREKGSRFLAGRIEAWQGHDPVLSATDFRLETAPDGMQLEGQDFRINVRHGPLDGTMAADSVAVTIQEDAGISIRVTGITGRMSVPGMKSGQPMRLSADGIAFDGNQLAIERLSAALGPAMALVVESLEFGPGPGGALIINARRMAASPELIGRFRHLQELRGLTLPPLALSLGLERPTGDRRRYTARLDSGVADIRLDGWLDAGGEIAVTAVAARGLLHLLGEAGSPDPLSTVARMGLFYGDVEQANDEIRTQPELRQATGQ